MSSSEIQAIEDVKLEIDVLGTCTPFAASGDSSNTNTIREEVMKLAVKFTFGSY